MLRYFRVSLFLLSILTGGQAQAIQHWQLLPEKSGLAFTVNSTFHEFNGKARELSGSLEQDISSTKGIINIRVNDLTTDNPDRDHNMYQMFDVSRSPQISFIVEDTDITRVLNDREGNITFTGTMNIHHISQPLTLVAKGYMDGDVLVCQGRIFVHLKDYGLKPPTILGLIRVSDEVIVRYDVAFIKG